MASTSSKPAKRGPSLLAKAYLFAYNAVETVGWSSLLYQLIKYYVSPDPGESLYDTIKWPLIIFQNAAILEILHASTGLVHSNPVVTFQQVFSRVMVVCGVVMPTIAARNSVGLPLALLAWCITEIIRYSYYALNLVNAVPHFLIWLRYTTFIALYPIGVTGELLCLYAAQGEIGKTGLWSFELPNSLNFSFHYRHFMIIIMLLYIPLFPQLYLHMFSQRKKILGDGSKDSSDAKKSK